MLLLYLCLAHVGTLVPCLSAHFCNCNYHVGGFDCGTGYGTTTCPDTSVLLLSSSFILESNLYRISSMGTLPFSGRRRTGICLPVRIGPLLGYELLLVVVLRGALFVLPVLLAYSASYIRIARWYVPVSGTVHIAFALYILNLNVPN